MPRNIENSASGYIYSPYIPRVTIITDRNLITDRNPLSLEIGDERCTCEDCQRERRRRSEAQRKGTGVTLEEEFFSRRKGGKL